MKPTTTPPSSIPGANESKAAKSGPPGERASALLQAGKDAAGDGRGSGQAGKRRGPYKGRGGAGAPAAQMASAPSAPALPLFNEENTGRLVAIPFTLAAIATDWDRWRLEPHEQRELAATGSATLNEFVRIDPKWIALSLFSMSLAGVALSKAVMFQAEMRIKKSKAIDEQKRRAQATQPVRPTNEANASRETPGFLSDPAQVPPTISS